MGLINLQTDLKSLKFGKDRPAGGDSGQPYIQTPIPDSQSDPLPLLTSDSILRGGIQAPIRAAKDVARLTKYLFSPKSQSGYLFIAKENLLSRTSVKTQASYGAGYAGKSEYYWENGNTGLVAEGGGTLNQGVYSPLNTLAQAGVGNLGIRLNQKGIDPTGLAPTLSLNKYEKVVKDLEEDEDNRLVIFYKKKNGELGRSDDNNLYSYAGGPGSILGVGKTHIRFADQRTGKQNIEIDKSLFFTEGFKVFKGSRKGGYGVEDKPLTLPSTYKKEGNINYLNFLGASNKYTFTPRASDDPFSPGPSEETITLNDNNINPNGKLIDNTFKEIGSNSIVSPDPDVVFNKDIQNIVPPPKDDSTYTFATYKSTRLAKLYGGNKDFNQLNIENRVNLGDPGARDRKVSYNPNAEPLDKINASALYTSTDAAKGRNEGDYNDLAHFRIGIIDPDDPFGNVTYMTFRSYIDSFSDSYNSQWKPQQYMGRGEKFYKYGGFDRSISMAFTVVAQSFQEMRGMYSKLNYLASSLAPTYTPQGYMAGNLCKMTVGDYIYEQYGFISSITYDVPQDSSWDLSLSDSDDLGVQRDPKTNPDELPYMIKVTGLKFTPIHNFRPEIVENINTGFPTQRYITNGLELKGYNAKEE